MLKGYDAAGASCMMFAMTLYLYGHRSSDHVLPGYEIQFFFNTESVETSD